MNKRWLYLGITCILVSASALAEPATVYRPSQMRTKPLLNAPLINTLAEGTRVELLSNQGGWSKVKVKNGKTGYIRLLNLRLMPSDNQQSTSGLNKLGNVIRTGSTGNIATTGVKGISKEDLAKATPLPDEVAKMERYAVSADKAKSAAKSVKLTQQSVAFMEAQ